MLCFLANKTVSLGSLLLNETYLPAAVSMFLATKIHYTNNSLFNKEMKHLRLKISKVKIFNVSSFLNYFTVEVK